MLPDGWSEYKLKELAQIDKSSLGSKTDENYTFSYISLGDVDDKEISKNLAQYRFKDAPSRARKIVKENDVLMSTVRPNLQGFAKIGKRNKDCIASTGFAVITPKQASEADFILQYLFGGHVQRQIYSLTVGSNYPALNSSDVKNLKVYAPIDSSERIEISNRLTVWDLAISSLQSFIKEKQKQKKALMRLLLTGKHRFPKFEGEDWKKLKADKIFKSYSKKKNPSEPLLAVMQDIGVVPRDMLDRRVAMPEGSTDGYKLIEPGDFVISLRSFQGGLEYSYYRGIVSPAYTILKSIQPINDDFYRHYFKSYEFIGRLAVAVIGIRDGKQISYDDFSFMDLPCPSLVEQQKIAAVLNAADKEIDLLTQKLKAYQEQKKGLMQQLLTGKKRVNITRKEAA